MRRALLKTSPEDRDALSVLAASAPASRRTDVSRILLWTLGVLVVILLVALIVLAGWATSQATAGKMEISTRGERGAGTFGEPVRDGQFEFVAGELSCGTDMATKGGSIHADGQFCSTPVHVSNIGNQPRLIDCSWLQAKLADGDTVPATEWATKAVNDGQVTDWVGPGSEEAFTLVFEIPAGQHIVALELHDFAFSKGAVIGPST